MSIMHQLVRLCSLSSSLRDTVGQQLHYLELLWQEEINVAIGALALKDFAHVLLTKSSHMAMPKFKR